MTINFPSDIEVKLRQEADKQGVSIEEYVRQLLERQLSAAEAPKRRVTTGRGKFAHVPFTVEDLHRERQEDKEREERELLERAGQHTS